MAVTEPKRYVTMATLMKDIYTERLLESEASLLPVRKSVKKMMKLSGLPTDTIHGFKMKQSIPLCLNKFAAMRVVEATT